MLPKAFTASLALSEVGVALGGYSRCQLRVKGLCRTDSGSLVDPQRSRLTLLIQREQQFTISSVEDGAAGCFGPILNVGNEVVY